MALVQLKNINQKTQIETNKNDWKLCGKCRKEIKFEVGMGKTQDYTWERGNGESKNMREKYSSDV